MHEAFEMILIKLRGIGDINISPARSAVFLKHSSTFAAIKPLKEVMKIEFYSDKKIRSEFINKLLQISKNRVAHSVIITRKKDVRKELIDWIKHSYKLTHE